MNGTGLLNSLASCRGAAETVHTHFDKMGAVSGFASRMSPMQVSFVNSIFKISFFILLIRSLAGLNFSFSRERQVKNRVFRVPDEALSKVFHVKRFAVCGVFAELFSAAVNPVSAVRQLIRRPLQF